MKSLRKKVGEALRKQRERLGWSLERASEASGLSKSMCWRIERGDNTIKIDHLETYAGALGFVYDDLVNEVQGIDLLKQELIWIETDIDLNRGRNLSESIKRLKELKIPAKHPYMQIVEYLKGKAYFYAKKYEKAEKALRRAIDLADRHIEKYSHLNIMTSAYNVLSNLFYQALHRYEQALKMANEATSLFVEGGERQFEYYQSMLNKGVYLEKLGRLVEAERLAQFLWENLSNIHRANTQAAICEHYARVKMLYHDYSEARKAILMGLEIARRNNLPHRASDLALTWGEIHEKSGELREAEQSYKRALAYCKTVRAFNALGKLYLKERSLDDALEAFSNASQFKESRPDYVDALIGIGKVRILQGDKEAAKAPLLEAESLADDLKEKLDEIQLLLAECYRGKDPEKYLTYTEKRQKNKLEAIFA